MKKFQYRFEMLGGHQDGIRAQLNALAADSWRLICVHPLGTGMMVHFGYFEKEVEAPAVGKPVLRSHDVTLEDAGISKSLAAETLAENAA